MATATVLVELAAQLQQAADREDWSQVEILLGKINQGLAQNAGALSRASLETLQSHIQLAQQDAERRRNEIGLLLKGLSGSAATPNEAA